MSYQLVDDLRAALRPKGSADVVLLRINRTFAFFEYTTEEVDEMLDELERKLPLWHCGLEERSSLERLGLRLLISAAGMEGQS